MKNKIGFTTETNIAQPAEPFLPCQITPRKSVVQVHFPARGMTLSYYNDQFDLQCGDLVYVEGKLEGIPGFVRSVSFTFKIKRSDYKRVIAVADTSVHGDFCMAGSHFVTFDRTALPKEKIRTWFLPPSTDESEFVTGSDDFAFCLDDLKGMNVNPAIAERGHEYYAENKVRYLSVDGTCGYAIVEGSEPYEVEFTYKNGEISALTCSCFCIFPCKHEFAAMLQLKETLDLIETHYADKHERSESFAAVLKGILFKFAIDGKEQGMFTL